jgi:ubiquinone/menaquinone biosynthesis C-methylase UbiE
MTNDDTKGQTPLSKRYLDSDVVERFDQRYDKGHRAAKAQRWNRLIQEIISELGGVESCVDIPCGTGFITQALKEVVSDTYPSDVSLEMTRHAGQVTGKQGFVADVLNLPLKDDSIDLIVNLRFMVHFTHKDRIPMLNSMARVARRYLLVNYNHRYTIKYVLRNLRRKLGIGRKDPAKKCTRKEIEAEAASAGLTIRKIYSANRFLPLISERWLVLFEKGG